MAPKITFQKNYTRDTALFLQDIWARDQSIELPKVLGKVNPYLPGIVHHVVNGTVEIWENGEATEWLVDAILEKNIADPTFLPQQIEEHKRVLAELKVLWDKGARTVDDLKAFSKLLVSGLQGFNVFYRAAIDERTPPELRDMALEVRKVDAFFSQNDVFFQSALSQVFPQFKGYENYIFPNELDNPPSVEVLAERKKHFVLVDGAERFLGTLAEYEEKHPEYLFEKEQVESEVREFKGQTAYKGKVRGAAKLVFLREQIGKVEEGNILVSPMTTPDLLSAMHKAAAFVTDEGGITCHAAIVSREMKKPCVIGTKIATQVLKDGDMVEVDADNGRVRIV